MTNQRGRTVFDSWKEIAAYLHRTEKTCRRWEKELKLPVHRLEDSPRARVFAYKDEVDTWIEKAGNLSIPVGRDDALVSGSKAGKTFFLLAAAVLVLISVILFFRLRVFKKSGHQFSAPLQSIAILPFEDLSPGKDHAHLAIGMTDTLISTLSTIPGLRIPARTSSSYVQGKKSSPSEIGRLLRVAALIIGSIQVSGETIRIAIHLVNIDDGMVLWSKKYDRSLKNIFAAQDEISQEVVRVLKLDLTGGWEGIRVRDYTPNHLAYDFYLRGFFHAQVRERSREGLNKAIEYYQKAIEKDPRYALAYAGLADAWIALPNYEPYPRDKAYEEVERAATKALELDPELAEAHVTYGCYLSEIKRDREGEIAHFRKAISLKPGNGWAHNMLAYSLVYQGKIEECLKEAQRALELDPLSCVISRDFGVFLYYAGRYDDAIQAFEEALELYPDHVWTYYYLGCTYLEKSMYREALSAFRKAFAETHFLLSLYEGLTYARMGNAAAARNIMNQLLEKEESIALPFKYFHLAVLCLNLGEKEKGFRFLRKSEEYNDQQLGNIKVHPLFKHVRAEPEFQAVLRKMKLE